MTLSQVFQSSNTIRNIFVLPMSKEKAKEHLIHQNQFKFKAEITSSSYGFIWNNENCQFKWKAVCFGDCGQLLSLHMDYFDSVGISHQMSYVRTPQQNGVVERRDRTLVEAARTMLIFSHAPLFLWAEAIATACFTQNRSIIHCRFNKTPYELINDRKPDISFLYVFGALCYPKNDREDIGKLGAKATARTVLAVQEPQVRQTSMASTSIADTAPTLTKSSSHATYILITSQDVDELNPNAMIDGNTFINPFANSSTSAAESSSSQNVDPSNMHTFYQPYPHAFQWTKDHPLEQVAKPTEKHLKEVKRIFLYLRGTINTGLWYSKDSGFELIRFSDVDYAGCKDTFKSTFGGA
nr:retrovirus-related Pol polyprotein from transposon TNT 1-94 [Tanacetum cinerariifolium]